MKSRPSPIPSPTVGVAISIDLIQKRQAAIAKRTKALNTELVNLYEENSTLSTKKLELLREFDSVTR